MPQLPKSLLAWDTPTFKQTLEQELRSLDPSLLPLQQGLRYSSIALTENLSLTIQSIEENDVEVSVKTGIFYSGVIAGCNCSDDPSVIDENNEYCEALIILNKNSASASITLREQ